MATPDGGDIDLPYDAPYITKVMREQEFLHSERKVLSPDFKESENAESFESNCQVYLRAIS